jgi:hypothetical protein
MKAIKITGRLIVGCVFACCLTSNLQAQTPAVPWTSFQAAPPANPDADAESPADRLQVEINSLPQVPSAMIPSSGTFWSLQKSLGGNYPPLPLNPFASIYTNQDVKVYSFQDGSFLLNDLNVDYSALQPQSNATNAINSPMPQGRPETIDYTWLTLTPPAGGNAGQLTVETADWGGDWIWGIAKKADLNTYDPRESSWELMDPNYFAYDLNGGTYTFDMPPFDQPAEFYKAFDVQDYFQGYWTPIKYLGSNLAAGDSVTTNDVVLRFNLEGDIYKYYEDTARSVQATIVRPSGETLGCFAEISSNGIATITAPATSFASGQNYVRVSFVNEGPQYADTFPSQDFDEGYLAGLDVPGQEAYLQSLGINPSVTGDITNNYPHNFTGYLVFNAVPPVEDMVAAPYVAPYADGGLFRRTYKCQGGVNASFTVQLFTPDNQLIAETNGVTQLDGNNEYTFEADLPLSDEIVTNVDSVTAVIQAQPLQTQMGGATPNDNPPPSSITINYILDKTHFRGIYNTAGWCSMNYHVPFPAYHPFQIFWYDMNVYMDGFLKHAADTVLTDIGSLFQYGFSQAIPDPYVLSLIPAYQYDGSQAAHFADVLTNSIYMGINFLSHSGAGVDLFDDGNLNLDALSKIAGNHSYPGKTSSGQPHPYFFSYQRRMDVWMEASCGGAWRVDAEYFGTPRNVDQTHAPVPWTVAFGYDVQDFTPVVGCPHFEELGNQFYLTGIFGNNPLRAEQALSNANSIQQVAANILSPAFQGSPSKTCTPNSL